jgi:acyl-CoA thioester hydrolase
MGVVYHGNYKYFEMGRVEWLRNIGISYKWMEERYYASSSFSEY